MAHLKDMRFVHTARYFKWLLLIVFLLGTVGWTAFNRWEQARTVTYVIPPGAGHQMALGEEPVDFPSELTFTIGVRDTIVIKNRDDVVHTFGPFIIMPHTTLTKRFDKVRVYQNSCTLHKDHQMKLIVKPAPWNIFRRDAG